MKRKWQIVNGEKLPAISFQRSAVSSQRRVRQVPWQLTDQTCEVAWELSEFLGVSEFSETLNPGSTREASADARIPWRCS